MANSSVSIKTTPVTREKLAQALGNNQALIRLIENLVLDVTVSIPAGTDTVQLVTEENSAAVNMARAIAELALALATQANDGPPPAPPARASDDVPPVLIQVFPDVPDDLAARVASLEAQLPNVLRMISDLKEGPSP